MPRWPESQIGQVGGKTQRLGGAGRVVGRMGNLVEGRPLKRVQRRRVWNKRLEILRSKGRTTGFPLLPPLQVSTPPGFAQNSRLGL